MHNGYTEEQPTQVKKRFRNYNWTDAEVHALMKAWWDHHKDFNTYKQGCNRRPLYDKISFDIRRYGYQRTRVEAQTKLQNLMKTFRKERETLRQTGEKYSKWRYYNLVKRIVETDPQEKDDSVHDYLSSDEDNRNVEDDGASNAHIIKLTSSIGSDSDNPISCHSLTESKDTVEEKKDDSVHSVERKDNSLHSVERRDNSLPSVERKDNSLHTRPTRTKQKSMEDIMSAFLTEFKRSNAQLEKNDREIIGLLKENNELCKQQIELLNLFLDK